MNGPQRSRPTGEVQLSRYRSIRFISDLWEPIVTKDHGADLAEMVVDGLLAKKDIGGWAGRRRSGDRSGKGEEKSQDEAQSQTR